MEPLRSRHTAVKKTKVNIPNSNPVARKFPFTRVNNISPARTRLLDRDYKIV